MADNLVFEKYDNIYKFMDTISRRPNTKKFGDSSTSTGDSDWYGTNSYTEAQEQFSNGLPEKAAALKKSLETFKASANLATPRARPSNYYYGHSPNVPAAIIGLPKSMRRVEKTPQKVKAISILSDMTQNAGTSGATLEKAGCTVLQLVYALETAGYRVALDIMPFTTDTRRNGQHTICLINLKDWKHSLDIMKLSFPLTSPSMFRRFGFRWAETVPGIEAEHVPGYGGHLDKDKVKEHLSRRGYDMKATYFVDVEDCMSCDFNALKVAEKLGIKI